MRAFFMSSGHIVRAMLAREAGRKANTGSAAGGDPAKRTGPVASLHLSNQTSARFASKLTGPGPAAARYRKTKLNRIAATPPFWAG